MTRNEIIQRQRTAFQAGAAYGWSQAQHGYSSRDTDISATADAATRYAVPRVPRVVTYEDRQYRVRHGKLEYRLGPEQLWQGSVLTTAQIAVLIDLIQNPDEEAPDAVSA